LELINPRSGMFSLPDAFGEPMIADIASKPIM